MHNSAQGKRSGCFSEEQPQQPDEQLEKRTKALADVSPETQASNASNSTRHKTLVIACGAIAHELMALVTANNWQHLDIQCLPAEWHNTPERITPAIKSKIEQHARHYAKVFVAYADCGTGGHLDALLSKHQIERLPGAHCYSFFAGSQVFDKMAEAELGTFYLTDYLVDNFQRLILDELGISRHPQLLEQYFGHYTRLMYLRQDVLSPKKQQRELQAANAAEALGLTLKIHETGLAPFENSLSVIRLQPENSTIA